MSGQPPGSISGRVAAQAVLATLLLSLSGMASPSLATAQSVSPAEREALVRLRVERGGRAEEVDRLIRQADEAAMKGLPVEPLTNKIREGLAKGVDTARIGVVIQQIAIHLETAALLMRELDPASVIPGREAVVALLAESFGGGVTPDEVRELRRQAQVSGRPPLAPAELAGASKGLAFVKEARLPILEGTAVLVEGMRQGFRSHEILDLGREMKRREDDYRTGRANLGALRDAIRNGDRPDRLFRDSRSEPVERPSTTRPESVDRPERPGRPEAPARQEPPTRSEPAQRPERPDRPERPGTGRTP